MGRSEKRELESRLTVLLVHLLKWRHQPIRGGGSWQLTIDEQRLQFWLTGFIQIDGFLDVIAV